MTEAYPLRWPDGWPRTPAASRSRGTQFRRGGYSGTIPTFATGRKDVLHELELMRAGFITISSNVQVRDDGSVYSNVDPNRTTMKDPGVAIYFTRKGRPFVLAQDAYDTPGVNLRSLALALEAMRAVERHGGGTVGNKVYDGFTALPPPAGMKPKRPWWEVLRYPENADDREFLSVAEVEARFRTLVKKFHPDNGGDGDMDELTIARDEAVAELSGESS